MFSKKFGVEVEFTGLTRLQAAKAALEVLGGTVAETGGIYDAKVVTAPDGRRWKFVCDSSITPQKKQNGRIIGAGREYCVELVTPILTYYEDIGTLQTLIRKLREVRGFCPKNSGIHIHLNGADHTPKSIRNFVNIIASKNDLLYKSLQINPERTFYCKKMDAKLVTEMNRIKPQTFEQISDIWYADRSDVRNSHYHSSRYHFLNLHSFFQGNRTVELRGFNSGDENGRLHAGKVRAYVVLALALNHQALTQKSASYRKVQSENERFAMRTFLNRIGFIGDEFKSCREHLYRHLDGNAAWRYGRDLRNDQNREEV